MALPLIQTLSDHTLPPPPALDIAGAFTHRQRPRSADIGGLALAMRGEGSGSGWGGWDVEQLDGTSFAETLSAMHTEANRVLELPVSLPWAKLPSRDRHAALVTALDSWNFEPWSLTDDEALYCAELLFNSLLRIEGMHQAVGVSIIQLRPFLRQLSSIYRPANQYHNFRHALDVLQATSMFLSRARLVPRLAEVEQLPRDRFWRPGRTVAGTGTGAAAPGLLGETLRHADVFMLYIVSIGHDVGHPGLSNMFLKNADAPLARVYEGQSPLERMHCFFLNQLMRRHGMGHLLSADGVHSSDLRRLLVDTLLVTDLRVHFDWMARFSRLKDPVKRAAVGVDERRILLCQAVLKAADISNPLRPYPSAQHWSNILHEEWTSQAGLEVFLEQPVSMAAAAGDERKQADAQIGFIDTFAQPLFTAIADVVPEMKVFADYCEENRAMWIARACSAAAPPTPRPETEIDTSTYAAWFRSVFPLSLPPALVSQDSRALAPVPVAPPSKRFSIAGALALTPDAAPPRFPDPAAFTAHRTSVASSVSTPARSFASSTSSSSSSSMFPATPSASAPAVNANANVPVAARSSVSGPMDIRSAFKAACRVPKLNLGWLRATSEGHRS